MSILIAASDPSREMTWIASDTRATKDGRISEIGTKWVSRGGWALGNAGSFRTTCLLRANVDSLLKDIVGPYDVIERLREMLDEHGYEAKHDGVVPPGYAESFLLASHNELWEIGAYFEVLDVAIGHASAIGSGMEYALGAIWGYNEAQIRMTGNDMMTRAIQCAVDNDAHCGGLWVRAVTKEGLKHAAELPEGPKPDKEEAVMDRSTDYGKPT
jgi:hypothetical protein